MANAVKLGRLPLGHGHPLKLRVPDAVPVERGHRDEGPAVGTGLDPDPIRRAVRGADACPHVHRWGHLGYCSRLTTVLHWATPVSGQVARYVFAALPGGAPYLGLRWTLAADLRCRDPCEPIGVAETSGRLGAVRSCCTVAELYGTTPPCNNRGMTATLAQPDLIRCAIYLRISLDHTGDQLAVRRQRQDCLKLAEQRGWIVVAEYVDNSISASDSKKNRPGYNALVSAYEAGEFDALICWDLDRLTRQPRQLEDWVDRAEQRGLLLVTTSGEADLSTDAGRLFARIKAAVGKAEVERKGARQRRAAQQRAERGLAPMGPRLTGYKSDGTLVPDEALIVAKVFERFGQGDSLRSLATWLTEEGVATRSGRPWNPSSVRTMLKNPRYAGRAIYDGKETGQLGNWTAIVSEDLFLAVQARLSDPRRKTQVGTDRRHLGSGLYECGECGRKVRAWSGCRYRCPDAHVNRTGTGVDDYVLMLVRERLSRPDLRDLLAPADDDEHAKLLLEAKRLRARLVTIENEYDEELIDGRRYKVATEKVQAELTVVEAKLARRAMSAAGGLLLSGDPLTAFNEASLMMQRAAVESLCTVKLYPHPRGRKTFDENTVQVEWKQW